MAVEDSGLSCSYYEVYIEFPHKEDRKPYVAECTDIIRHLEMTPDEANIFKELWRTANARLGKKKKGNTQLRAYEKIYWSADGLLRIERRKLGVK